MTIILTSQPGQLSFGELSRCSQSIAALLDDLDSRLWMLMSLDIGMRLRNGLFSMIEASNTAVADLLVDSLENKTLNENQRALIIRLIGRTRDARLVDTFMDMLMIGSTTLQGAAAEALGYIGDVRAVSSLTVIVEDATDSRLQEIAINALGQMGDRQAGDVLLPLLDHADEWIRRASATALADLHDKRAVRQVLRMSREDDSQIVRDAADAALRKLIMDDNDKHE